eukprot:9550900-Lingulodinium_polyedra.AAC.1
MHSRRWGLYSGWHSKQGHRLPASRRYVQICSQGTQRTRCISPRRFGENNIKSTADYVMDLKPNAEAENGRNCPLVLFKTIVGINKCS